MIDFVAARKKMVENQLRTSAITDRRLLSAMAEVPRENFVPTGRRDLAYIDEPHLLTASGARRYLSAPAPFGKLVQLAEVNTSNKLLDLGCGTGYSVAVLASLCDQVVAVESDAALAAAARTNLAALGISNARIVEAPIEGGARADGPFDVIVLEGAVDLVPDALLAQLADGGRLVALIRQGAAAAAHLYVKSGRDVASRIEFNTTLPPLPGGEAPAEFVF